MPCLGTVSASMLSVRIDMALQPASPYKGAFRCVSFSVHATSLQFRFTAVGGEDASVGLWMLAYNITCLDDRRLGVSLDYAW